MEIEREENIFYNLIKNETSLTEVFCNFMRYENFRNLFIDIINKKIKNKENIIDKSKVKFQDFDTEAALEENEEKAGRIDLQLKVNEEIYLFEIKIETYTSLTKHQPKSYLEFLKDKNENLFFVLPKGYFHKNEIFNRWENKNHYRKKEIENHNIIYWEDILDKIRKQEFDKANIFINEFCNILGLRWFDFEKIEFTKYEIELMFSDKKEKGYKMLENVNVPVLMNKLFQIVVNTKIDYYKKDKDKIEQRYDYFGYFIDNKKNDISDKLTIWFGIDYEIWENTQNPISIQIVGFEAEDKQSLEEYFIHNNCFNNGKNELNFQIFEYKNNTISFYIPLEKEIFENKDENITQKLTEKIVAVINILKDYK